MKNDKSDCYSPFKMVHHLDNVKAQAKGKLPLPIFVQWDLSNSCNMNCTFCFYKIHPLADFEETDNMRTDLVLRTLDELKELGVKAVEFTGGGSIEMHPDYKKIIRRAKELGFELALVTNGTMLDNEALELIKDFEWVRFSVDASSNTTWTNVKRVNPYLYHKVFRNMKKLIKIKSPNNVIGYSFIVCPENYMEILSATKMAKSMGFDNIRFSLAMTPKKEKLFEIMWDEITAELELAKGEETEDFKVFEFSNRIYDLAGEQLSDYCGYHHLVGVIGANGCLYPCCVRGDETVLIEKKGITKNIKIEDIEIGMKVLTDKGMKKVTDKMKAPIKTPLIKFELKNRRKLTVTPDHRLYVNGKGMIQAKNIKMGDKLIFNLDIDKPKRKIKEINLKKYDGFIHENGISRCKLIFNRNGKEFIRRSKKGIPTKIKITEELCRFLGYYIAEGWKTKDGICFMVGKHEEKLIKDLVYCVNKSVELSCKITERRTGMQISIDSYAIKKLIDILECGDRALNKQIPYIFFNTDEKMKMEFLKAYFAGDGHYHKLKHGYILSATTISKKLSHDLDNILLSVGVVCVTKISREGGQHKIEGRTVNTKKSYLINISGYYNLIKLINIIDFLGGELKRGKKSQKRMLAFERTDKGMAVPIIKREEVKEKGYVYDIEVEKTHRFFVNNILSSNCTLKYNNKFNFGSLEIHTFREVWEGYKRKMFIRKIRNGCPFSCWFTKKNDFCKYMMKKKEDVRHVNFI